MVVVGERPSLGVSSGQDVLYRYLIPGYPTIPIILIQTTTPYTLPLRTPSTPLDPNRKHSKFIEIGYGLTQLQTRPMNPYTESKLIRIIQL